jgi:hypothetical protein
MQKLRISFEEVLDQKGKNKEIKQNFLSILEKIIQNRVERLNTTSDRKKITLNQKTLDILRKKAIDIVIPMCENKNNLIGIQSVISALYYNFYILMKNASKEVEVNGSSITGLFPQNRDSNWLRFALAYHEDSHPIKDSIGKFQIPITLPKIDKIVNNSKLALNDSKYKKTTLLQKFNQDIEANDYNKYFSLIIIFSSLLHVRDIPENPENLKLFFDTCIEIIDSYRAKGHIITISNITNLLCSKGIPENPENLKLFFDTCIEIIEECKTKSHIITVSNITSLLSGQENPENLKLFFDTCIEIIEECKTKSHIITVSNITNLMNRKGINFMFLNSLKENIEDLIKNEIATEHITHILHNILTNKLKIKPTIEKHKQSKINKAKDLLKKITYRNIKNSNSNEGLLNLMSNLFWNPDEALSEVYIHLTKNYQMEEIQKLNSISSSTQDITYQEAIMILRAKSGMNNTIREFYKTKLQRLIFQNEDGKEYERFDSNIHANEKKYTLDEDSKNDLINPILDIIRNSVNFHEKDIIVFKNYFKLVLEDEDDLLPTLAKKTNKSIEEIIDLLGLMKSVLKPEDLRHLF